MRLRGGLLGLAIWVTGALPGAADPVADAEVAARTLIAAGDALVAAQSAEDRVTALAETVRAYETGLAALRDGLRRAAIREQVLETRLEAERDRLARLLGALQTISRTPAPLFLIHPAGPLGSARAAMTLAEVMPGFEAEAARLKADLDELRLIRETQEGATAILRNGLEGAQEARVDLSRAISEREMLPPNRVDNAMLEALIESSDTLDAFATGLGGIDAPAPPGGFATADRNLPLPVTGTVLRAFGATDQAGIARPGWVIATQPRALVTLPAAASVRYAGPLLDYGNVIVVEPEPGYLLLVAGLAETYVQAGDVLGQGAPLGLMGGDVAPDSGLGSGQTRRETLYMEVRQDGTPADPGRWFGSNEE